MVFQKPPAILVVARHCRATHVNLMFMFVSGQTRLVVQCLVLFEQFLLCPYEMRFVCDGAGIVAVWSNINASGNERVKVLRRGGALANRLESTVTVRAVHWSRE